jgi:iron(III) transport system substrate-binding protein
VLKSREVLASYRSPNAKGIPEALVDPEGFWTGFSARMRVIAYNTKAVKSNDAPQSVFDLADPKWKGQVAMADPRFGSTSFHVAALYALAGDEKMDGFFRRLKANGVRIVDGNSVVRDLVARWEVIGARHFIRMSRCSHLWSVVRRGREARTDSASERARQ